MDLPRTAPRYKAFPQFNAGGLPVRAGARVRSRDRLAGAFSGDTLVARLARALLVSEAVPFKEVLENFEFFEHVRRYVRAPTVVDACCGHGLAGLLYAVHHRDVAHVRLVDQRRPESAMRCLEALEGVAPWIRDKVQFETIPLEAVAVDGQSAVIGVHACGRATDSLLDIALAAQVPVAVMPCCYPDAALPGPPTLGAALGVSVATDVYRTYRLDQAGYRVRWSAIPEAITPMNRILCAWPHASPS